MTHSLAGQPDGALGDVEPAPGGLVAVGDRTSGAATSTPSRALVTWHSENGDVRTETIVDATEGRFWNFPNLAAGPAGFIITAFSADDDGSRGASWISHDGTATSPLQHPVRRSGGIPTATDDGYVIITTTRRQ